MNLRRLIPAFCVFAPTFLAHCTASDPTSPDPNNASPAAALDIEQPIDPTTGNTAWGTVGQPMTVQIDMEQTGPGTCSYDAFDGVGETCTGPDTPMAFQLSSLGCDDDLCDVTQIQVGTTTDLYGRALLGDVVTLVPKSTAATLRATATSDSFTASASLALSVTCPASSPGCR